MITLAQELALRANIEVSYLRVDGWLSVLKMLKKDANACYLGAYKTDERMRHYKYSNPLYQEEPFVVVANNKVFQHFGDQVSLEALFASNFIMGVQKGFSYGLEVDTKLAAKSTPTLPLSYLIKALNTHDERTIFSLINLGRIDYLLLNGLEYQWNIKAHRDNKKNIRMLTLTNPIEGNFRYLMCSKGVSDQTLETLNHHIDTLHSSGHYNNLIAPYYSF